MTHCEYQIARSRRRCRINNDVHCKGTRFLCDAINQRELNLIRLALRPTSAGWPGLSYKPATSSLCHQQSWLQDLLLHRTVTCFLFPGSSIDYRQQECSLRLYIGRNDWAESACACGWLNFLKWYNLTRISVLSILVVVDVDQKPEQSYGQNILF